MILLKSRKNQTEPSPHNQKASSEMAVLFAWKERKTRIKRDAFCLHIQESIIYTELSRIQLTKSKELGKAGIV